MKTTKTRSPKKVLTEDEVREKIQKHLSAVAKLEASLHNVNLDELIKETNIVADIKALKEKSDKITDVAILTAIAKATAMKRIEVTQKPVSPRSKSKTSSNEKADEAT